MRPLTKFVEKRDWEAKETYYGKYWLVIRIRIHILEDCLLIDERIIMPTQLPKSVLDSLHLTNPGTELPTLHGTRQKSQTNIVEVKLMKKHEKISFRFLYFPISQEKKTFSHRILF